MKKNFLLVILSLVMVITSVACGSDGNQTSSSQNGGDVKTIKLGHTLVPDEGDPYHYLAMNFSRLVEEKSEGSIIIDVLANGQLGQETAMFEGMQVGTVDMAVMTNAYVSNFVPDCSLLDMPFIFSNVDEAHEVLDGSVGKAIFDSFEGSGVVPLDWGEGGFRTMATVDTPIREPDDFIGIKVRCMENEIYLATYAALGTNAVPMAWGETLTGLQQKTIEGLDAPISVFYTNGFPDFTKYVSLTNHFYSPLILCISESTWANLTEEEQQIMREAAEEAKLMEWENNVIQNDVQLKSMVDEGMEVIEDVDYEAFREAVKPVYEEVKEMVNIDIFNDLMEQIGN